MKYGSLMKAFKESCVLHGEMKWDVSLECTSVGQHLILIQCIFLSCNKCVLDGILSVYVIHPPREWGVGMSRHRWRLFFLKTQFVIGGGGTTRPQSLLHNRTRSTKTSLSRGSLQRSVVMPFCSHFAFRVPYIYAIFITFHLT